MLDPTCPDITGAYWESLCRRGMTGHDAVRRGVAYLLGAQEKDGSCTAAGCELFYGSFLAMRGLRASGAPEARDAIGKAAQWLRPSRTPMRLGESCASYDREVSPVPDCPSQTAWPFWACWPSAIAKAPPSGAHPVPSRPPEARRHMAEEATTGTGFPNVFYLTYGMYRDYFPLLALAQAKA